MICVNFTNRMVNALNSMYVVLSETINNNNNNRISIAPYGRNFRGASFY